MPSSGVMPPSREEKENAVRNHAAGVTEMLHSLKQPDKLRALGIMANSTACSRTRYGLARAVAAAPGADPMCWRATRRLSSSFRGRLPAVLLHMVSAGRTRSLPVYFLDTGKHFPEDAGLCGDA